MFLILQKDNSVYPHQKEITSSDDIITSSEGTVLIQKSESSKTKVEADKTVSNTSFQPVNVQKNSVTSKISGLHSSDFIKNQIPLSVLSQLSNTVQEMKSQNEISVHNNDDETLTNNDNRNTNDKINSYPDTTISENTQNQLPPLPEPTLSPLQIPEAQPLNTFTGNDGLVDSSEEENVESNNVKIKVRELSKIPILQPILHLMMPN